MPNQGSRGIIIQQTCRGPFSTVSKPNVATKNIHSKASNCFQDLEYVYTSAPLQILHRSKLKLCSISPNHVGEFSEFCKMSLNFPRRFPRNVAGMAGNPEEIAEVRFCFFFFSFSRASGKRHPFEKAEKVGYFSEISMEHLKKFELFENFTRSGRNHFKIASRDLGSSSPWRDLPLCGAHVRDLPRGGDHAQVLVLPGGPRAVPGSAGSKKQLHY